MDHFLRDKWIFGISESRHRYILRNTVPRFYARVTHGEAGIEKHGLQHVCRNGDVLHDFTWVDPPPNAAMLGRIIAEAEEALLNSISAHCG